MPPGQGSAFRPRQTLETAMRGPGRSGVPPKAHQQRTGGSCVVPGRHPAGCSRAEPTRSAQGPMRPREPPGKRPYTLKLLKRSVTPTKGKTLPTRSSRRRYWIIRSTTCCSWAQRSTSWHKAMMEPTSNCTGFLPKTFHSQNNGWPVANRNPDIQDPSTAKTDIWVPIDCGWDRNIGRPRIDKTIL